MKRDIHKAWKGGIDTELNFWERWFATGGLQWKDEYKMRLDPNSKLQDFLLPYLNKNLKKIKILDVGAGPVTYINKKYDGGELEIHACDVLADQYDKIIEKHNIHLPVRTKRLDMLELTTRYPENTFDITYARNCIDHSYNPLKCIEEMIKVTKEDGGFIILHHVFKEGSGTGWVGFHLWDIYFEDNKFFIQAKDSELFDITEIFKKSIHLVDIFPEGMENMFVAAFTKKAQNIL